MSQKKFFNFEVKTSEENGIFSGYASVFNMIDNQGDSIMHDAFDFNQNGVVILWQHRQEEPIGKILNIQQDKKGLYIRGQLITDIKKGYEAYRLLQLGIINGLSIGYITKDYSIDQQTGTRIIKKLDLVEISLVTFPANEHARVRQVKNNHDEIVDEIYAIISILREG
jgi:HK97 family phage prohead protease